MNEKETKFKSVHGSIILLLAIIANITIQLLAGIIVGFIDKDGEKGLLESAYFNFALMALIQVIFTAVYFLILQQNRIQDPPVNYKNKIVLWTIPLAVAIGFLAIPAFYPATLWFTLMLEKLGYVGTGLVEMKTVGEFIIGSLIVVVAAPIGEELIFRSALLPSLNMRFGAKKAVVLSALAFMLMHMNPSQTVYQFLLGIVLAVSALVTGSVVIPAIIHASSNVMALLLDYTVIGEGANSFINYFTDKIFFGVVVSIVITAVFSLAVGVLLWLLYKRYKAIPEKVELASKPLIGSVRFAVKTDNPHNIENDFDRNSDEFIEELISDNQTAKERAEKRVSDLNCKNYYIAAIAICTFMWIVGLVSSILT